MVASLGLRGDKFVFMEMQLIDITELSPQVRAKIARNEEREYQKARKEWERVEARKAQAEQKFENSLDIEN